jgi:hypothetical protein
MCKRGRGSGEPSAITAGDDEAASFIRERVGCGKADPQSSSCDKRYFAVEVIR